MRRMMIESQSWFGRIYAVSLDGQALGTLEPRFWSENADIQIGDRRYALEKEGLWSSRFQLRDEHTRQIVAEADRESIWSSTWLLRIAGRPARLQRAGWFSRTLEFVSEGRLVGTVRPISMWTSGLVIEAEDSVSDEGMLLAALVTLIIHRRAAASSGL